MTTRLLLTLLAAALLAPSPASAHCDTLDGPVVKAGRAALETGNAEAVLAWVRPADEPQIRAALARARSVRKGDPASRDLADQWFLETVVRVHRASEGAPFEGLKPAGAPEPAVAAADAAVESGDPAALERLLVRAVREGIHEHLSRLAKETPPGAEVEAGRRWVAAYVPFVHWAEGVYAAASAPASATAHAAEHGGH